MFFLVCRKNLSAHQCAFSSLIFSPAAALLLLCASQIVLFLPPASFPVPQRPAVPGTFGPLRGSDPTKLYGSPRVPEPHPGEPVQQHQHFAMQVRNVAAKGTCRSPPLLSATAFTETHPVSLSPLTSSPAGRGTERAPRAQAGCPREADMCRSDPRLRPRPPAGHPAAGACQWPPT